MTGTSFDVTESDIRTAAANIYGRVRKTPLFSSPTLTAQLGCQIDLKLECLQIGGSFKVRGVINKLLKMTAEEHNRGVVTVSGGNHAIAVALAAGMLGVPAKVVMASSTPVYNIDKTRSFGAEVCLVDSVGDAFAMAEDEGRKGSVFLHPFDDPEIIAGHGTLGLEIADASNPTHVFVSIGGGGLFAGVSAALKARNPDVKIIGVETEGATTMTQAMAEGRPVTIEPTSIVKTLAPPFVTDRTLAAARLWVDEVVVVSDRDAVEGVFAILESERVVVEPAAGCVLAAAARYPDTKSEGMRACLVLCGSNVDLDDLARIRADFSMSNEQYVRF